MNLMQSIAVVAVSAARLVWRGVLNRASGARH